jgi:5-methylcytosine-specific restriction endonuclease McrA
VTLEQVRELKMEYGGKCAYCRIADGNEIDHVVPLARGGRHEIANILPACRACNASKGTKLLDEWQAEREITK